MHERVCTCIVNKTKDICPLIQYSYKDDFTRNSKDIAPFSAKDYLTEMSMIVQKCRPVFDNYIFYKIVIVCLCNLKLVRKFRYVFI